MNSYSKKDTGGLDGRHIELKVDCSTFVYNEGDQYAGF
jgi:hypothetical protein